MEIFRWKTPSIILQFLLWIHSQTWLLFEYFMKTEINLHFWNQIYVLQSNKHIPLTMTCMVGGRSFGDTLRSCRLLQEKRHFRQCTDDLSALITALEEQAESLPRAKIVSQYVVIIIIQLLYSIHYDTPHSGVHLNQKTTLAREKMAFAPDIQFLGPSPKGWGPIGLGCPSVCPSVCLSVILFCTG